MTRLKPVEQKHPSVRQLIDLGRRKGYLLYDEIYEILPDEIVAMAEDLDEIYVRFGELGIAVLDRPERYLNRAHALTEALKQYLWSEHDQRFFKYLKIDEQGNIIERINTLDASTMGVYLFGVLPPDHEMVVKNNRAIKEKLWVPTKIGGIARYQDDWYQRDEGGPEIQGNPWIITTLWYAMWITDLAKKPEEMSEALELIRWAADKTTPTGVMPEQVNFKTGKHESVSPLTWSQATFVEAVLKYCHRLEDFGICNYMPGEPAKKKVV